MKKTLKERWYPAVATIILAVTITAGCADKPASPVKTDLFAEIEADLEKDANDQLTTETHVGPVVAQIALFPKAPRLGDVILLHLSVTAPEGVDIEMPQFGDALGRFSIVDYDWRQTVESKSDGRVTRHEQIYQLQAAASGPLRIPQLRVEFVDRRPPDPSGASTDARGETRELLTDEISVAVAPIVLAEGETTLRSHPGRLSIATVRPWHRWWFWLIGAVILSGLVIGLWRWRRERYHAAAKTNAFEQALTELKRLNDAGLPDDDELDAWYVELSSIIRHYLEHRFSVRAPELTTEEFLREAHQAPELTKSHRQMLGEFLTGCDRVKFAGHRPNPIEQQAAIASALKFVSETRPEDSSHINIDDVADLKEVSP